MTVPSGDITVGFWGWGAHSALFFSGISPGAVSLGGWEDELGGATYCLTVSDTIVPLVVYFPEASGAQG